MIKLPYAKNIILSVTVMPNISQYNKLNEEKRKMKIDELKKKFSLQQNIFKKSFVKTDTCTKVSYY